jgi:hypothetical protein
VHYMTGIVTGFFDKYKALACVQIHRIAANSGGLVCLGLSGLDIGLSCSWIGC